MEDKVTKSLDAYKAIRPLIERPEQEECFLICLNQASRIKDVSLISIGSDTAVFMPVKVILKKAILNMATGIIIAHTHPSGNVNPSESDIKETENGLGVSCINMSCGYYEPHTNNEFTSIPDLMNALHFVEHIIETCTKVYPHEYTYTGKAYFPKCNAWDDCYTSLLDVADMAGRKSKREVTPPKLSDYGDAEDLIYDLVWRYPDISADELWDYVSSDLETVGMDYSEFCEYVDLYRTY